MEKQMESPIPLHNEIPQLGFAIFPFRSPSILIKRSSMTTTIFIKNSKTSFI
jgi:hypothetical protein